MGNFVDDMLKNIISSLSNFLSYILYGHMFDLTSMRINVMRIGSFKLCVVSKCDGKLVITSWG